MEPLDIFPMEWLFRAALHLLKMKLCSPLPSNMEFPLMNVHLFWVLLNSIAILLDEMYFQAGSSSINKNNKVAWSSFSEHNPFKRPTAIK